MYIQTHAFSQMYAHVHIQKYTDTQTQQNTHTQLRKISRIVKTHILTHQ